MDLSTTNRYRLRDTVADPRNETGGAGKPELDDKVLAKHPYEGVEERRST
jgi:hypothetical protein